jgi:SAM-dependent methyltransferase
MSIWSSGRYESVAERISRIAVQTVDAAAGRRELAGAAVVDLACGTGSAALAAAARGAVVTAVDVTPELVAQAEQKAAAAGAAVTWITADAAHTGLPDAAFDTVVSNMGIVFVDPQQQVDELERILKPAGVLAFSTWVRDTRNPLFDPIIEVFGAPSATGPDQWGDREVAEQRLTTGFRDIEFVRGAFTWEYESVDAAVAFVTNESPMHVAVFSHADDEQRARLTDAFVAALTPYADDSGVRFDASYAVVTAVRR